MKLSEADLKKVRETIVKLQGQQAKDYDRAFPSVIASRTESKKRFVARNPILGRQNNLKFHFGIDIPQYEAMLVSQGGVCAICSRTCPTGKRLSVDHCHSTGRARGLLCMQCNTGLGKFADDVDLLDKAKSYLLKAGATPSRSE